MSVLTLLAGGSTAHAQTYTVRACWDTYLGAQGLTPLSVGHIGPAGPSLNGCVDHQAGLRAEGYPMAGVWYRDDRFGWSFTAPPRTHVSAFQAEVSGHSGYGDGYIPAPWFRGFWSPDTSEDWPSTNLPFQWEPIQADNLSLQTLEFGLRCPRTTCDFPFPPTGVHPGDNSQQAQARDILITVRDDEPPKLETVKPVPSGWRGENAIPVSFKATDNVGVHTMTASIDGTRAATLVRSCFALSLNVQRQPCADDPPPFAPNLEAAGLADGPHTVTIVGTDVAGNESRIVSTLYLDHTAPGSPRDLRLLSADSWSKENRFVVSWTNPSVDGSAPIVGIEYQFCPLGNRDDDTSGCVKGRRDGDALTRVDDLEVPGVGQWRLRVALRDAAGNLDWDRAAKVEPLRFDGTAPMVAFLPFDPADPARVRVAATDDSSGVASVEVEARRRGDGAWQPIPVTLVGEIASGLLDDDQLVAGTYELRARAIDRAGNERATSTVAGNLPMVVQLPIRTGSELAVGHPKRVRVKSAKGKRPTYKRVLVAKPEADHGASVTIEGKLADAAGNPRVAAPIQVLERIDLPGRTWRELALLTTGADGGFKFRALPGPARHLRFVYPGSATTRARSQDVELRVRAGVTLTPSRRRLRNGEEVVFRGRLLGGPVPEAGKLLALQARTIRGWRTFATPRARAGDGKFSARYRFTNTPVTLRYAFRVVVPKESGYPYARGVSRVAHVLVRGS